LLLKAFNIKIVTKIQLKEVKKNSRVVNQICREIQLWVVWEVSKETDNSLVAEVEVSRITALHLVTINSNRTNHNRDQEFQEHHKTSRTFPPQSKVPTIKQFYADISKNTVFANMETSANMLTERLNSDLFNNNQVQVLKWEV